MLQNINIENKSNTLLEHIGSFDNGDKLELTLTVGVRQNYKSIGGGVKIFIINYIHIYKYVIFYFSFYLVKWL